MQCEDYIAIYLFLSADHGKLSSERQPNISVESLKLLNGIDEEVGGGLMHYESCLITIQ